MTFDVPSWTLGSAPILIEIFGFGTALGKPRQSTHGNCGNAGLNGNLFSVTCTSQDRPLSSNLTLTATM
jgi:hypothetical protein